MDGGRWYRDVCCYVGCNREERWEISPPAGADFDQWLNRSLAEMTFQVFGIYRCEGRIYCTEDHLCPWHYGACHKQTETVFIGSLCPEHTKRFKGEDYGDYFRNIAKADPELFDRTRIGHEVRR